MSSEIDCSYEQFKDPPIDPDGYKDFAEIFKEEQRVINGAMERRFEDGKPNGPKFALAFSGGGIRAAAFQCGVLWQLAQQGLLKNVEYLTAVSGGGYIAMSFATHALEEWKTSPPKKGEVDAWYRRVVAKSIVRMQQNAGDFVRDFRRSGCGLPTEKSGFVAWLPRFLDIPILLLVLLFTICVNPFFVIICFFVPIVVMTEHFFGQHMRDAFCLHQVDQWGSLPPWWIHFVNLDAFQFLLRWFFLGFAATITFLLAMWIVPWMQDPAKKPNVEKHERVKVNTCFLLAHGIYSFLVRFTTLVALVMFFLLAVLTIQTTLFTAPHGSDAVQQYCKGEGPSCLENGGCLPDFLVNCTLLGLAVLGIAIVFMPYLGKGSVVNFVCLLGPIMIMIFLVRLTQFRVFGPYTKQDFIPNRPFDIDVWEVFAEVSLVLAVILIPFYNNIRSCMHTYYKRCLVHNFFANGKDTSMMEMKKCDYLPFIILTGTSSDYRPPIGGDEDVLSEISFSSCHCGSIETGYVDEIGLRSIGMCAALSAAGCMDAAALTLNSIMAMRFWLEALNLSWGNYILFEPQGVSCTSKIAKSVPKKCQNQFYRTLNMLPSNIITMAIWVLVLKGYHDSSTFWYRLALKSFMIVFAVSFLNFWYISRELAQSPFLRQLQQATQYCYHGKRPPPMLYITDGGCRDCTTILQLVMRRQERILLVLAAADPTDELGVLKTAINIVKNQELAYFYNPVDPRRSVEELFDQFKTDKKQGYLHVGITYPEIKDKELPMKAGHLYIVKNRLPPDYVGRKVEPHMTVQEVMGDCDRGKGPTPEGIQPFDEQGWGDMTTDKLGPWFCCDCCHTSCYIGNCGPKFPHGNFANFMYMTPMWFSSLSRLAFDVSPEVIKKVLKEDQASEWEKCCIPSYEVPTARRLGRFGQFDLKDDRTNAFDGTNTGDITQTWPLHGRLFRSWP